VSAGANGFNHVINLGTFCSDPQHVQGAQVSALFVIVVMMVNDTGKEWTFLSSFILCVHYFNPALFQIFLHGVFYLFHGSCLSTLTALAKTA